MKLSYFAQIWVVTGLFLLVVDSAQVTLLDTRNATSDLGWPTSGVGWAELTSHDENDADLRTFQVCQIRNPNQNNWLRTPYMEVGNAQRIYVEIRFTIRSCEGISRIVSCKETFNLYFLESEVKNDARASHFNADTYTKVDTIAADERFKPDKIYTNTETRIISPLTARGLYIAFQDTGACMTIMHVRIYYKMCTETLRGLAWFPVTSTGPEITSLVDVRGVCIENAARTKNTPAPSLHCNVEGQWLVLSGNCQCQAGFEPSTDMTACNECAVGKFKPTAGNSPCKLCPRNSFSVDFGSTSCLCTSGFYRSPRDGASLPCTKPPSEPTMAESVVNKTSVNLTWSEPRDNGGRNDVTYSVSCDRCDSSFTLCSRCSERVDFIPKRTKLTRGRMQVEDLTPHTHYRFKIYSFNGASRVSKTEAKFAEVRIKTNQAAPSPISPVRVLSPQAREVLLQWNAPVVNSGLIIDYQILYRSTNGVFTNVTKETKFKLSNLTPLTSYIVQVRARSEAGYGLYSRATAFRTKPDKATAAPLSRNTDTPSNGYNSKEAESLDAITESSSNNQHLVITVAVTCTLLIIALGVLIFCWSRRNGYTKAASIESGKYPGYINNSIDLVMTRTYVDPSTYEDPYVAIQEFTKEIDFNFVNIDQIIGRGEFGEVCKGVLAPTNQTVAIKTLKVGYSNQEKLDFLGEAAIMGQFEHPNVIRLKGVITKSRPLMIISEYMENGSLDAFLKANEGKLTTMQITMMLHKIASGMRYLTEMGYVHRDLAARNILLDNELVCKVSDFGLSRELEKVADEEVAMYTTRGGMIPIRWTAPEAITKRTFSAFSDVWSFGIVTWEVLSYGERPYWEMSNQDVVHFVESGYRLPAPCFCPYPLHKMMLESWNRDRTQRPTFVQLVTLLDNLLQDSDCLQVTINNRPYRDQDDCIPEILDLSSLGQWLDQMHLLHYKSNMLTHGCVTAEQIMRLTSCELERMGISDLNDVNTILRETILLRQKIETMNDGGPSV